MRSPYGYDAYRGRSGLQTFLMVLIVILIVVLLLAVAVFFLLQKYIVYTDDGQARLELPFWNEEQVDDPLPTVHIPVVIPSRPTPTPTPTSVPSPPVWEGPFLPVSLLRATVTEGLAEEYAQAAGGNALYFNMKADDGTLGYVSDLPAAIQMETSAADTRLNEGLRTLAEDNYLIARVSCFKDNAAPQKDNTLAVRVESGNWRDINDNRWLNVAVPEARAYVIGVCVELAELGFDEIVLEHSGYPTQGLLEYIRRDETYDPDHLTAPVELFYEELAAALADYPQLCVSVAADEGILTGSHALSGLTDTILQNAYRVYVPDDVTLSSPLPAGLEEEDFVLTAPAGNAGEMAETWGGQMVYPSY